MIPDTERALGISVHVKPLLRKQVLATQSKEGVRMCKAWMRKECEQ